MKGTMIRSKDIQDDRRIEAGDEKEDERDIQDDGLEAVNSEDGLEVDDGVDDGYGMNGGGDSNSRK